MSTMPPQPNYLQNSVRRVKKIERGTSEFKRVALCMVLAGISTFALMNCVQPLLPAFCKMFSLTASQASLSVSINIGMLALAMPVASLISERVGRKPILVLSLCCSGITCILSATAEDWTTFLTYRAIQGALFSGVPAIAMAYISEEISERDTGYAAGIYVSGAAVGGMLGRVISGIVAEDFGWQAALISLGFISLVATILFVRLLPKSAYFVSSRKSFTGQFITYSNHLQNEKLRRSFLTALLSMGSLMMIYNLLSFKLLEPPFFLSQSQISLVFSVFLAGIFSSTLAGRLSDRYGARPVSRGSLSFCAAGGIIMLTPNLAIFLIGLVLFTVGCFGVHAVANGAVAKTAKHGKSEASTLYFISYYLGGALLGWVGGVGFELARWPGVIGLLSVGLIFLFVFGLSRNTPPIRANESSAR